MHFPTFNLFMAFHQSSKLDLPLSVGNSTFGFLTAFLKVFLDAP
jgi:hypothetical protein